MRGGIAIWLAVLCLGCSDSTVRGPTEGSRGGDCYPDRSCDPGLECFRGICVPEADGDIVVRDASVDGSPPVRDAGPDGDRDAGLDAGPDSMDAGPDAGDVDSGRPDAGDPPDPTDVATGSGELIAVFAYDGGIVVVDQTRARLMDRSGTEIAGFEPGREITAAASDGTYIAIADRAAVTTLDADLSEVASAFLTRYCSTGVIVSGHRFICGPDEDWDRIYYTYDLVEGAETGESDPYTYSGMPMGRIPGTDYFVAVSGGSPSDFHLYEVPASGITRYVNESPYHGDIAASTVYAFDGSPATHLINHEGVMLHIFGDDCSSDSSSGCFDIDGELGSLPTGERYDAMTDDGAGSVFGIFDETDRFFDDPYCESGCTMHEVDPSTRTVVSSITYSDSFLAIPELEHDPFTDGLLLGVQTAGDDFDGYTEYEVRLVYLD